MPKAIFEIVPGHYYVGQWYVAPENAGYDVLAMVWKECLDPNDPAHPWKMRMRTRYYASDDAPKFDGTDQDTKSVLNGTIDGAKGIDYVTEMMSRALHGACRMVAAKGVRAEVQYLAILGNHETFARVMNAGLLPGHMHVKRQKDMTEAEKRHHGLSD